MIRPGEAFVAELALVGPDPCVDAHVVLKVIVMDKFSIAVDAQIWPLPGVFPHVNLQFVLPGRIRYLCLLT